MLEVQPWPWNMTFIFKPTMHYFLDKLKIVSYSVSIFLWLFSKPYFRKYGFCHIISLVQPFQKLTIVFGRENMTFFFSFSPWLWWFGITCLCCVIPYYSHLSSCCITSLSFLSFFDYLNFFCSGTFAHSFFFSFRCSQMKLQMTNTT